MVNETTSDGHEALDLQDLLLDESNDILSDYVSISLEPVSEGTRVSVTTVEDQPATYSGTLTGVTLTDLHCLVEVPIDS